MKRITLATVALVVGSVVAAAQEPPTPPTPPARPAPAPRPDVAPPASPAPRARPVRDFDFDFDIDSREISRQASEAAREAAQAAREASRIDQEQVRDMAREASRAALEASRIDQDRVRELARIDADEISRATRESMRNFNFDFDYAPMIGTPRVAPMPMPAMVPMAPIAPMAMYVGGGRDFTDRPAPAPWIQGDPADSAYRVAREALNGGDYGRAARLFNDVVAKYPKSQLLDAAQYYEALARYKIGTTDELHQAAKILQPMVAKLPPRTSNSDVSGQATRVGVARGFGQGCNNDGCSNVSYSYRNGGFSDSEVAALYTRVNGALAQRGDATAQQILDKTLSQSGGAACDREDQDVKIEAINALFQMGSAAALPAVRKILDRKDDCSVQLRRNAVFILGRQTDTESANLLISVAKSDPSVDVRSAAINYLGRLPGDAGMATLEDLLKNDQDERIQRAAIRALNASDNVHARTSMRALIERKDAPMNLRIEAINSFSSDRTTNDDAAYLRGLYARAENDQMKDAILGALSRIGGAENDAFVLNVAKNTNESSRIRSQALSRLSRSPTTTSADLGRIYDAADSYDVRVRIVQILGSRKDPESADKLMDIAKTSTVPAIKREALQAFMRRNDPRATQLLNDILDGKVVKP